MTTSTSQSKFFCFNWMLFELKNATATFQRAFATMLFPVKYRTALLYLRDAITYLMTVTKHLTHVREVLQLLQAAGGTLEFAKDIFFDTAVFCLGQLEVHKRNPVAIKRATARTNQTKLWFFFGMCNLYRRLVPGFAKIATPLDKNTFKRELLEFGLLAGK